MESTASAARQGRRDPTREYVVFITTHPMKLIASYRQQLLPIYHPPTTTVPGQLHPKSHARPVSPTAHISQPETDNVSSRPPGVCALGQSRRYPL
eukprot:2086699-Rhodomonas_salina.1